MLLEVVPTVIVSVLVVSTVVPPVVVIIVVAVGMPTATAASPSSSVVPTAPSAPLSSSSSVVGIQVLLPVDISGEELTGIEMRIVVTALSSFVASHAGDRESASVQAGSSYAPIVRREYLGWYFSEDDAAVSRTGRFLKDSPTHFPLNNFDLFHRAD